MASGTRHPGKLERAMYRSRWRDGLLDLLGGLGVTGLGWSLGPGNRWIGILSIPLLFLAWTHLRSSVVEPRIGRATFSRGWRQRESDGTRGAALFGMVTVAFLVTHHLLSVRAANLPWAWAQAWMDSVAMTFLVLLSLTAAMVLGLRRFLFYSVVLLAAGSIGERAGADAATQILLGGAVIASMGFFLFARFLLAHPHPPRLPDIE